MLLCPHQCEASKSPSILGCLVFSLRCFAAHTPSHVSSEVCTFMYPLAPACQGCGPLVLHALQPWRKSLRKSFVMHLFERSTVWCSLLVLKMSYSAAAAAHKSACIHVHGNSWYQCRLSLSSLSSLSQALSLSLYIYIYRYIYV